VSGFGGRWVTGLLAALSLAAAGCTPRPAWHGWAMEPALAAPDVALWGSGPRPLSLAHPDGRPTLLAFGYTSCPDVCPTTLSGWRRLRERLGADGDRVRFVFVSVDYRNDRPAWVGDFARHFDPRFIGVVADSLALLRMLPRFKADAGYVPLPGGHGSTVAHTAYTYLIDGRGVIRRGYDFDADPGGVRADVRRMLRAGS